MGKPALCKCEKQRLDEYPSEKYVQIHRCQKIWTIQMQKKPPENWGIGILCF